MPKPTRHTRSDLAAVARHAMIERGLEPDFSPEALAEVDAIAGPATIAPGMRDLRDRLWCSIDNDDSRDLDQLSVCETTGSDAIKVLVAVADVASLVSIGDPVDEHAAHNTTSVYTAARVFPMLPERLSTDLTSLNPGQDRLALVTEYDVDATGTIRNGTVYRALVHNHAQLAYRAVGAWLLDKAPLPPAAARVPGLDQQLRDQSRAATWLRDERQRRGALELRTIEPRPVFEGDAVVDLQVEEGNPAKTLIEEFMVGANGVVARFLAKAGRPSLRRVVRSPERWAKMVAVAAELDETLPAEPSAPALEAFLARRKQADPLRFPDLSLVIVKLLGRGEYVAMDHDDAAPGHFGLALRDYSHSTAPNRRFPDLITQRLVFAALEDRPAPYDRDQLSILASRCTEQESAAAKVERQVRKSVAAMLLEPRIGDAFDGVVTAAGEKGTYVRVFSPPVEGRIVSGERGLDVGDAVRVALLRTDFDRGFIDFGVAPTGSARRRVYREG